MKYSISTKYNMEFFMVKAGKTDYLVNNEVLWINSQKIASLVPVEIEKDGNSLNYNVTGFIPLKKYLKKKMQINDFIRTYNSVIKGILEITNSGLDYRKILVDERYLYVNPITKKCKFIFIPYMGFCNNYDIKEILKEMVSSVRLDNKEAEHHAKEVYAKIESQYMVSWEFLQNYSAQLEKDELDSFNKIRIMNETGKLNSQQMEQQVQPVQPMMQAPIPPVQPMMQAPIPPEQPMIQAQPVPPVQNMNQSAKNNQAQSMEPITQKFCPECGHKCKVEMRFCNQCGTRFPDELMFGYGEKMPIPPIVMPVINTEPSDTYLESSESETTVLGNIDDYDEEATTVLSRVNKVVYPRITRQSTQEVIQVNKSTFIIGKGKASDYIICDNSAISRSHLTVITRDGKYYVSDNGSTNHSYINGEELVPHTEYEVTNDAIIKLADEEFVVNI